MALKETNDCKCSKHEHKGNWGLVHAMRRLRLEAMSNALSSGRFPAGCFDVSSSLQHFQNRICAYNYDAIWIWLHDERWLSEGLTATRSLPARNNNQGDVRNVWSSVLCFTTWILFDRVWWGRRHWSNKNYKLLLALPSQSVNVKVNLLLTHTSALFTYSIT